MRLYRSHRPPPTQTRFTSPSPGACGTLKLKQMKSLVLTEKSKVEVLSSVNNAMITTDRKNH
eukprot:scaffold3485_cov76-Cyclotella_meneghiniana.AAC.5